jgi:hypothetical protein
MQEQVWKGSVLLLQVPPHCLTSAATLLTQSCPCYCCLAPQQARGDLCMVALEVGERLAVRKDLVHNGVLLMDRAMSTDLQVGWEGLWMVAGGVMCSFKPALYWEGSCNRNVDCEGRLENHLPHR